MILAGGPGQAASTLAPFAARLTELRRTRDVVLIDQRGTGRSSPLVCAAFKPREDDVFEPDPMPRARACAAELKAKGVDLAQYTTTRVDRRPRSDARGAGLRSAGTCGAAATARASRRSTCGRTPIACAR